MLSSVHNAVYNIEPIERYFLCKDMQIHAMKIKIAKNSLFCIVLFSVFGINEFVGCTLSI